MTKPRIYIRKCWIAGPDPMEYFWMSYCTDASGKAHRLCPARILPEWLAQLPWWEDHSAHAG